MTASRVAASYRRQEVLVDAAGTGDARFARFQSQVRSFAGGRPAGGPGRPGRLGERRRRRRPRARAGNGLTSAAGAAQRLLRIYADFTVREFAPEQSARSELRQYCRLARPRKSLSGQHARCLRTTSACVPMLRGS